MYGSFLIGQVDWVGPSTKIWDNTQCPILGKYEHTLEECKQSCLETTGCNAIIVDEYENVDECDLLNCPWPIPEPTLEKTHYHGYKAATGI